MSHEDAKIKHSKRLHDDKTHIKKQVKIAKTHGIPVTQPHRLNKHHAMDCGNPNCVLCGNPRKVWKEKTIQEKKFDEIDYD